MRVVATAGHVDHGKSSLVAALTGTDPDRWPEEKARGLTIDLGFAFTVLASGTEVGFVDVPGHVRFLKNMLAGVGAVEAAVLVVAADEGWMPQSEEHLRILELLGLSFGVVAVTKADTVDDDVVELAVLEVGERLALSSFSPSAICPVDSRTGRGLAELRLALDALLAVTPAAPDQGRPRLWVDRVFAARGSGTVVTGTLAGGALAVGQEVTVVPGRHGARVRRIESNHRELGRAGPGTRVAMNLAGVGHGELQRGHAVVLSGQWVATSTVDVALSVLPGVELRRRCTLKVYAGSGEHDGTALLLDDSGRFARLRLATPLPLAPGDRLVLREPGRQETVAGAQVLDVLPVGPPRLAPARLALPLGERLLAGRPWLRLEELGRHAGLDAEGAARLADRLVSGGLATRASSGYLIASGELARLRRAAGERVAEHHRRHPLSTGLELPALADLLAVDPTRLRLALEGSPDLVVDQGRVRRVDHGVAVSETPEGRRLLDALSAAPFAPPSAGELGVPAEVVRGLVREGHVVDLGGVILTGAALADARARVVAAMSATGSVTVAQVRDLLGSSRRYVLAILARLDTEGVTRRRGDDRLPGPRGSA